MVSIGNPLPLLTVLKNCHRISNACIDDQAYTNTRLDYDMMIQCSLPVTQRFSHIPLTLAWKYSIGSEDQEKSKKITTPCMAKGMEDKMHYGSKDYQIG